jgi:hypothetical protein
VHAFRAGYAIRNGYPSGGAGVRAIRNLYILILLHSRSRTEGFGNPKHNRPAM